MRTSKALFLNAIEMTETAQRFSAHGRGLGTKFFARAAETAGELYILDDIGPWAITAQDVSKALIEMKGCKTLAIYINSPGGVVSDGVAIYNMLVRNAAKKTVYVEGVAASIASIIAMAGDKIVTAKNAMWMIHEPMAFVGGNSDDMRKAAEALDKMRATLIDTYAARTKQSKDDLSTWMAAETWMNADEAKARGFTDEIGDLQTKAQADAKAFSMLKQFNKVPDALRAGPDLDIRSRLASTQARAMRSQSKAPRQASEPSVNGQA